MQKCNIHIKKLKNFNLKEDDLQKFQVNLGGVNYSFKFILIDVDDFKEKPKK